MTKWAGCEFIEEREERVGGTECYEIQVKSVQKKPGINFCSWRGFEEVLLSPP
jgi:hypothetical protein